MCALASSSISSIHRLQFVKFRLFEPQVLSSEITVSRWIRHFQKPKQDLINSPQLDLIKNQN